jgi:hypothetical protein
LAFPLPFFKIQRSKAATNEMTPQVPFLLNAIPRKGNGLCVENGTPRNIKIILYLLYYTIA